MQIKKVVQVAALVLLMSVPTFGQWIQPNAAQCNPQQMFASYQTWFNNADLQLRQQTAGMSPAMKLQYTIRAREGELSQWGSFLQQYYPMLYVNRLAQLQQHRQLLAQMMNGGGMPSPVAMPFPGVSSGGGYASRCVACKGTGVCRLCSGTGIYQGAKYTSGPSTPCSACNQTGRCSICTRCEIRTLDQ